MFEPSEKGDRITSLDVVKLRGEVARQELLEILLDYFDKSVEEHVEGDQAEDAAAAAVKK